ncbi:hypothetical protein V495_02542 [Pseudogymnoascus sp. VKM F-4514 (FW-929)]|nr:hypothetical protein V495_02542 [Pseudogymnoascus sp. VKM F-4514 (FW-929)]KFY52191.1 hypothetical protein V497_08605 [Pseudogymnoascus sp. VKM F-4516 (FW-969)]
MPSRTLPTFTKSEVESHNTATDCYVTLGEKVCDLSDFVESHPGGGDLILEYAGKDVTEILKDEVSHTHSEAAYEILDDGLIGFLSSDESSDSSLKRRNVNQATLNGNGEANGKATGEVDGQGRMVYEATGVGSAEDLSKDTDLVDDYKKHKFLDLNKPLLMQVFFGGFSKKFYLEQVHRPRHYKGGDSAPIFGNFLEPLSKTSWYMIPIIWLPQIAYGLYRSYEGLGVFGTAAFFGLGLFIWTLLEYGLHRCLFHLDQKLPDNRVAITLHFLLHGVHHYLPMDKYRLVMPPTLFVALALPFWKLAHTIFAFNWFMGTATFCGGVFGYVCYDLTHYFLHHAKLPEFYQDTKKWHMQHHFMDYENGFGVTSRFWDTVFGTELVMTQPKPKIVKAT